MKQERFQQRSLQSLLLSLSLLREMTLLFHITLLIIYLCKHLPTLSQPSAVSPRAIDRGCLRTQFVKSPELYQLDCLCSHSKELLWVEHRRNQGCAKMHWLNRSCLSFDAVSLLLLTCSAAVCIILCQGISMGKEKSIISWILDFWDHYFNAICSCMLYPTIPSCVLYSMRVTACVSWVVPFLLMNSRGEEGRISFAVVQFKCHR